MNKKSARDILNELQMWHNKVVGVGLVLPDLTDILKALDNEEQQTRALRSERSKIQEEIDALKVSARQHKAEEQGCQDALRKAKIAVDKEQQSINRLQQDLRNLVKEMDERRNTEEARLRASLESIEVEHKARLGQVVANISTKQEEFARVQQAFESFKKEHGFSR